MPTIKEQIEESFRIEEEFNLIWSTFPWKSADPKKIEARADLPVVDSDVRAELCVLATENCRLRNSIRFNAAESDAFTLNIPNDLLRSYIRKIFQPRTQRRAFDTELFLELTRLDYHLALSDIESLPEIEKQICGRVKVMIREWIKEIDGILKYTESQDSELIEIWEPRVTRIEEIERSREIGLLTVPFDLPEELRMFLYDARDAYVFNIPSGVFSLCRTILERTLEDICLKMKFIGERHNNNLKAEDMRNHILKVQPKFKDELIGYYSCFNRVIHGELYPQASDCKRQLRLTLNLIEKLYAAFFPTEDRQHRYI